MDDYGRYEALHMASFLIWAVARDFIVRVDELRMEGAGEQALMVG
jgi:hypothetical protein